MVEEITADVLVAGGGVGGLMAAYSAQRCGASVILLGGSAGASNRISVMNTALGYTQQDTPAALFDDMFRAGGYLNDISLLANICARIGPQTELLGSLGVPFARDKDRYARRQATGSSSPRGVYTLGMVGVDISHHLRARMSTGVRIVEGATLLDLYTTDGAVTGGLVYDAKSRVWLGVRAGAVVLATGGAGKLFRRTTNPRGSAGVGYAVALEAGAELVDMEFVSYEPFITWAPGTKGHDLPTTVLREGAKIRNGLGEEFIDTAKSPAKDIICRAMVNEVRHGRGTPLGAVYYDLTDMDPTVVGQYPQIQQALKALRGKSASPLKLEVMPAQHYLMGGVKVDARGATAVSGLFAVGEVAGGTHGAHRLAGAGGMEVVALGAIAGEQASRFARGRPQRPQLEALRARPELLGANLSPRGREMLAEISSAMETGCGIVRRADQLAQTVHSVVGLLEEARSEPALAQVARAALVSWIVATCALRRQESRGDHFREDFPIRDDVNWLGNMTATLEHGYEPAIRQLASD
jgi:aspartate oxidase